MTLSDVCGNTSGGRRSGFSIRRLPTYPLSKVRPQPLPLDEARLLPRARCEAGPFLERRRMERGQAQAFVAAAHASSAGTVPARHKAEPGDLRGIPVIGRGVGGVSPGSSPESAIDRVDGEREWRRKTMLMEPLVAFA